jgi:hypothetical protein
MNVEIGAEAAQFPEKEYINGIAVAVRQSTWAGRPVRQPYAGVNYIPHSGTKNLATVEQLGFVMYTVGYSVESAHCAL